MVPPPAPGAVVIAVWARIEFVSAQASLSIPRAASAATDSAKRPTLVRLFIFTLAGADMLFVALLEPKNLPKYVHLSSKNRV